jgi:hypothetical protein
MEKRTCEGCDTEFEVHPRERNPRRWCSQACRRWCIDHPGQQRPLVRSCACCGVDISERRTNVVYCSQRCGLVARGEARADPLPMRDCAVCGTTFQPRVAAQRCCPPTAEDKRRLGKNAISRCAKRLVNHNTRHRNGVQTGPLSAALPSPFDCAQCGKTCEPGKDGIAHHATRFCGQACKWEHHHPKAARPLVLAGWDEQAIDRWRDYCAVAALEAVFGRMSGRSVDVAYRRALRCDPCAYCGSTSGAVDHVDPRMHGGNDDWTNHTAACRNCNSLKGTLPLLSAMRCDGSPWPVSTMRCDAFCTRYLRRNRGHRPKTGFAG